VTSAIFVSVRNKATRLPGKSLLDLGGRTATEQLIARMELAREAELIVVTTSVHPGDKVLVELARRCGVETFRGSPEDKLDRYLQAARQFDVELAAIVDGDDPFCDPGYIDRVFRVLRAEEADFVTVTGLPVGVAANAVRVSALARVCELKSERDTEVWAGYFTDTGLFRTRLVGADPHHHAPHLRMTLDYPEDYQFFQAVFAHLHRPDRIFSLDEILDLLRRHPEIAEINRAAGERYEENLRRMTQLGLKAGVQA
jgi:spore coat polysaccharide biosynthesis protein SpsF (cytidylyltransferase family)